MGDGEGRARMWGYRHVTCCLGKKDFYFFAFKILFSSRFFFSFKFFIPSNYCFLHSPFMEVHKMGFPLSSSAVPS